MMGSKYIKIRLRSIPYVSFNVFLYAISYKGISFPNFDGLDKYLTVLRWGGFMVSQCKGIYGISVIKTVITIANNGSR